MTSHVAVSNRSIKAAFCSLLNPSRCSAALLTPLFCLDHLCSVLMPASVSPMAFCQVLQPICWHQPDDSDRTTCCSLGLDHRRAFVMWLRVFSAALLTPLVHVKVVFHRSSLNGQKHLPVISSC